MTVDGIASLVERLASHPGIREIDVSSNSVTEADAHIAGRHLLNLAQQNPQVTVIYCSYLEMSESMLLSIEQALDWNIYHRAVSQTKLDESWKTYMSVLQFCNGKMVSPQPVSFATGSFRPSTAQCSLVRSQSTLDVRRPLHSPTSATFQGGGFCGWGTVQVGVAEHVLHQPPTSSAFPASNSASSGSVQRHLAAN